MKVRIINNLDLMLLDYKGKFELQIGDTIDLYEGKHIVVARNLNALKDEVEIIVELVTVK